MENWTIPLILTGLAGFLTLVWVGELRDRKRRK